MENFQQLRSWIGGGANQAAMKEMFEVNDEIFSSMITVDVIVANIWMGFLLYGAGITKRLDNWLKADSSSIEELKSQLIQFKKKNQRIPSFLDLMVICSIAFGITGLSHLLADNIAPFIQQNYPGLSKFSLNSKFFWLIIFSTTGGWYYHLQNFENTRVLVRQLLDQFFYIF